MEEYQEENNPQKNQDENSWAEGRASANRFLGVAVVVLLVISGMAFAYGYHQRTTVRDLTAQASASTLAMSRMQDQVNKMSSRLNELTAAQAVSPTRQSETSVAEPVADSSTSIAETPTAPSSLVKPAPMKHPTANRRAPTDKRYTQLQTQLAEQEKQLKDTQQQVEKYRSDLEGNINSTRDELNGSIAKTHEELVALEKRGERNYYEFDLSKSKQFERVGPLSLSLRKADTKHKSYDLAMIVDDNQLTKKQVNLYEPISIHIENESQPMMVVVNRIEKNIVHGYISAPKYKASELASAAAAAVAPPAGTAPAADNNRNSQPPPQP
jgi:uncharacterized coiled-coil protein SlyX